MAVSRKFCEQPFDWSLLVTCLHELNAKWNPEHVYTEEVDTLRCYFTETKPLVTFCTERAAPFID